MGQSGVMLAARRADVEDLNARARLRLQAARVLTGDELTVAGRNFAVRDRVLCGRNDRRLGVLNGDVATVEAIDRDALTLTVRLDRGDRTVELPARYLEAGHVAHAYAMTAHKAQGATVDRAWVLGSDAAYREWAYVALSRARAGSRLCLVGGADDATQSFAEALNDSGAQRLALEQGVAPQATAANDAVPRFGAGERRLRLVDHAMKQAQEGLQLAEVRLAETRSRLDQHTGGLRRLTRRDETALLRRGVARAEGDVAAWRLRLDELAAEHRAVLIEEQTRSQRERLSSLGAEVDRATHPRMDVRRRMPEMDRDEGPDFGIA